MKPTPQQAEGGAGTHHSYERSFVLAPASIAAVRRCGERNASGCTDATGVARTQRFGKAPGSRGSFRNGEECPGCSDVDFVRRPPPLVAGLTRISTAIGKSRSSQPRRALPDQTWAASGVVRIVTAPLIPPKPFLILVEVLADSFFGMLYRLRAVATDRKRQIRGRK